MTDSDWSLIELALEHVYAGSVGDEATQIRTDALAALGRLREQAERAEETIDERNQMLVTAARGAESIIGDMQLAAEAARERAEAAEVRAERAEKKARAAGDSCVRLGLRFLAEQKRAEALEARAERAEKELRRIREDGIMGRDTAYRRRDAAEAERDRLRAAIENVPCLDPREKFDGTTNTLTRGIDCDECYVCTTLRPLSNPTATTEPALGVSETTKEADE